MVGDSGDGWTNAYFEIFRPVRVMQFWLFCACIAMLSQGGTCLDKSNKTCINETTGVTLIVIGLLIALALIFMAVFMRTRKQASWWEDHCLSPKVLACAVLLMVGPILIGFGSQCVASEGDEHCGAGGRSGGTAMLIIGMFTVVLTVTLIVIFRDDENFRNFPQLICGVMMLIIGPLLIGFGSKCVDTDGVTHCGVQDRPGGTGMVVFGVLCILFAAGLAISQLIVSIKRIDDAAAGIDKEEQRRREGSYTGHFCMQIAVASALMCVMSLALAPVPLLVLGAGCLTHHGGEDDQSAKSYKWCGAGGEVGGWIMVVTGIMLLGCTVLLLGSTGKMRRWLEDDDSDLDDEESDRDERDGERRHHRDRGDMDRDRYREAPMSSPGAQYMREAPQYSPGIHPVAKQFC